jgi:hypothetical protein
MFRTVGLLFGAAVMIGVLLAAAEPRMIELAIQNRALPRERRVIGVKQGDEVTLRWTADAPVTVHLHGYDIEQDVKPGTPTVMTFTARAAGRFPIELHGGKGVKETTIGYLEVQPR